MQTYLRFAAKTDYLPNHFFTKPYDQRLLFVLSGFGELRLEDRCVPIAENTVCFYPAATAYHPVSLSEKPMTFITVNFDFAGEGEERSEPMPPVRADRFDPAMARMTHLDQPFEGFRHPLFLANAHTLREPFLAIVSDFGSDTRFARQKAQAHLSYVLYTLLEGEKTQKSRACEKVLRFLNENYLTIRSNAEVASRVNYNGSYLNKLMRRECGCGIHHYLIRLRLNHARELLRTTDLSVEQIAEESGFVNAKHFSTLFAARFGKSPSAYRRGGQWI